MGWLGGPLGVRLLLVALAAHAQTTNNIDNATTTMEPEPTGEKKFGDRCELSAECGFRGAVCDPATKSCQCKPELPATNHIDKCGLEVDINGTCFFNEQCEIRVQQTECKDARCSCRFEMVASFNNKLNKYECAPNYEAPVPVQYVDMTMIGVLVGMALMFIIICVVLRLFSKARWRDNRTIFNTPNPRLMNVSLLRETKGGASGAGQLASERRGSRASSSRPPSRQPSQASLRPHSPSHHSQGSSSRGGSQKSTTSKRGTSPTGL